MVFKASKGGVRSGNTLRGLQTKRTKLYSRHACLIGYSNLGRSNFHKLFNKSTEADKLVGDTFKNTDVLLSLNKKQRWRVPAMMKQMISCRQFDKSTMIALLERHKLKRRANCVSFTSNGGRLPNIEPKQKKYFSFSLDSINDEQSNREKRRIMAKALKKQRMAKRAMTINTFTSDGIGSDKLNFESSKQEYRIEVLYPCPQSCSLTFNPKYTDVVLAEGHTGQLEVKANVKSPRNGQRRHRDHFNSKKYGFIDKETIEEDVHDMWEDSDYEESPDEEGQHRFADQHFSLDVLINQARKAQKLLSKTACPHKKEKSINQAFDGKNSHIICIDPMSKESNVQSTQAFNTTQYFDEMKCLDSAKVILQSHETTEESLTEKYGALYTEANCLPRRFLINITDDVANILSSAKSSSKNPDFMSYLVFIHDGVYDDGLEVYRVIFNSYSCERAHDLAEYISFSQTSIENIMNHVIGYLFDLKEKDELNTSKSYIDTGLKNMNSFLYDRMNLNVKTFLPSYAISDKSILEKEQQEKRMKSDTHLNFLSTDFDQDVFCDICYDNVSSSKIDAAHGTKLLKCGHHCCDKCWTAHFQSRLRDGVTKITCPGYDCSIEIGVDMLLSIIKVSDVALLYQRKAEEEIEESQNSKWCPNPACGRVITIEAKGNDFCQDVKCACGTEICFTCLSSAHWPASCNQAGDYLEKLATIKPPKDNKEEEEIKPVLQSQPKIAEVMEIEGRICPSCSRFINKNGGCPSMVCKCNYNFCWNCMKPFHNYTVCQIDETYLRKCTRIVRVFHRQQIPQNEFEKPNAPKHQKKKQKMTMYQRALQIRLESSKSVTGVGKQNSLKYKILSSAQKDLQFKKEIVLKMAEQTLPETELELKALNIISSIERLLKSSQEIKAVLHHVSEFSYVLVQDSSNAVEKQRVVRLADDLSAISSIFTSILTLGENQNGIIAFRRLVSIKAWAKRALDALISSTRRIRHE